LAPVTPTAPPTSITAGDTVAFEWSPADYPPSEGWTGAAYVVLSGSIKTATVTDDDQGTYSVSFAASDFSALITETEARIVFRVTGSGDYAGEIATIYDASVTILPNVTGSTGSTSRSEDEIQLDLVNLRIREVLATSIESYSVGGRSAQKRKLSELRAEKAILEARIRDAKGYGFRRRVVAFT
jgi:CRP-like cAMP-binding protein